MQWAVQLTLASTPLPTFIPRSQGVDYAGVGFSKAFCGVTIMRAGEAMELGLRECVKSVRVGHLLIQHEGPSHNQEPKVYYAKVPENICDMLVLLMDPVIGRRRGGWGVCVVCGADARVSCLWP